VHVMVGSVGRKLIVFLEPYLGRVQLGHQYRRRWGSIKQTRAAVDVGDDLLFHQAALQDIQRPDDVTDFYLIGKNYAP